MNNTYLAAQSYALPGWVAAPTGGMPNLVMFPTQPANGPVVAAAPKYITATAPRIGVSVVPTSPSLIGSLIGSLQKQYLTGAQPTQPMPIIRALASHYGTGKPTTPARPKAPAITARVVREMNSQAAAPAVVSVTDNATAPTDGNAAPPAPTMPEPVAPVNSITASKYTGGAAIPLTSVSNQQMVVPTYGVDSLDHQTYALQDALRYARHIRGGLMPVLSNAEQAATNRLQARNNLALTAATTSADNIAAYRAANDPTTREMAAQIAQQTGVPLDLALKQAMVGALAQQGNYALANRYESSAVIPAMEAENQRRVTYGLSTGANVAPMSDVYGNPYQSQGINTVTGMDDGSVRFTTSGFSTDGTANAAISLGRVLSSTAPLADAFSMSAADAANRRADANYRAQVAGKATEAIEQQHEARRKAAADAARVEMQGIRNQLDMMYKMQQQNSPTAPRTARVDSPAQSAQVMINMARLLPEDDPQRAEIAKHLLKTYNIDLDSLTVGP